jgi:hypothetical protein
LGDWYTIGVTLGVSLGLGMALSGILGVNTVGVGVAVVLAAALGLAVGMIVDDTGDVVAGIVGGVLGALAAAAVVHGALRRGATRMGVATYVCAAGLLVVLLAFVPLAGYVLAVAVPVLAARMRGRRAARYAGLRTLAK